MTRYNVFHRIHKGLRALLFDTSLLLQRTDFTMDGEAGDALCRLRSVISLFEKYQQWEDQYLLPAMTAYEPAIALDFEQDHEEAYLAGKKLETLLTDFAQVSLPVEKLALGSEITAQFEAFTLSTILQMGGEEQLVNKILWRYYTDAELQKIAWEIAGKTESSRKLPYGKWMFRGLNNNEIVRWLKEVRQTADEDGFSRLLRTAEAELQPGRWSLVQDVMASGAMVA